MEKPKFSAEGMAAWRAAGALERDEDVRNPDYLAAGFLGPKLSLIRRIPPLRRLAIRVYERLVPGGYYFHIARTKHIDATLERALAGGAQQVVVLGAGYDTRAYRFQDSLEGVRVFEVDHPPTQERKRARLAKLLGALPEHVTYVPMDFHQQRLEETLPAAGYDPDQMTSFIWEGVCMYLTPAAVDRILAFVVRHSRPESSIVFDYVYRCAIEGRCDHYGAAKGVRYVAKIGEPYLFGIEEGGAGGFLAKRGLRVVSHADPEELEQRYLIRNDGRLAGRVYGYVAIVHAAVAPR